MTERSIGAHSEPPETRKTMAYALDVLVPHFEDPCGLKASLDSVAGQTWRGRLRVIVVDDGSSDQAFEKARAYCEEFRATSDFDLLLLRNERNLGRPATRNRLLDAVEARHVAWLDAGDIWYPDKLAAQFEQLVRLMRTNVDVDRVWVSCGYDWSQHGTMRTLSQNVAGDQLLSLLKGSQLRAYLWTLLGTARAFRMAGRFDERLPRLQDLDYFITFVRAGGRIEVPADENPLCCYFKSDVGRNATEIRDCYKLILAKNAPALRTYPSSLSSELGYKSNRLAARFAMANDQYGRAAIYLVQAAFQGTRHSIRVLDRHARRRSAQKVRA